MSNTAQQVLAVKKDGHGGLLSSIMTLASGSALAQVITLAAMPFITRLYGPEAFGIFAIFVALTTLIISVASLQFAEVVVVAKTRAEADQALLIGVLFVLLVAALTSTVMWFAAEPVATLLGIPDGAFVLHLMAPVILLAGLRQVMRRWLLRERFEGRIAASEVGLAFFDRGVTLLAALPLQGSVMGLVVGRIAGVVAALGCCLRPRSSRPFSRKPGLYRPRALARVVSRYRHFALHSWGVLLENIAVQLPVMLIGAFLGPAVAGGVALARRVLEEPAIVVGAALAQSYFQHAASESDRDAVAKLTLNVTSVLIKCLALPAIIALSCAPELMPWIFGEAWQLTGWYAFILGPMFMVYLVLRPLNRVFELTERQREKGIFAIQNIVVIVVSLSLSIWIDNPLVVLALFSTASTLFLCYRSVWLMRMAGVAVSQLLREIAPATLLTLVAVCAVLLQRACLEPPALIQIATTMLLCLVYVLLIVIPDHRIAAFLQTLRKRR